MLKERRNESYNIPGPAFTESPQSSEAFTHYQHLTPGSCIAFWNGSNEDDDISKAEHGTAKFFARFRVKNLRRNRDFTYTQS